MKVTPLQAANVKMRAELDCADIWQAVLAKIGNVKVMGEVRVFIEVPGGGDWSGMDLDVDARNPVVVEYTVETTPGHPVFDT